MPIKIPATLPAYNTLRAEGIMMMREDQAELQEIRPMRIALLNLMPKKIETETQFSRLIAASPLQVELTLVRPTEHVSKTTSQAHIGAHYQPFQEIRDQKFDGMIITGAPIEHLPYEEVTYWDEMREIMDWTQTNVHSTFGVCWGGMAMLLLEKKAFGCYPQRNLHPISPFLRGFSDNFVIPVSRWTEVKQADIDAHAGLVPLLGSPETGACLVEDPAHRALYIFNHFEYDSDTQRADELLPRRRPEPAAAEPLEKPRAPALRQLDRRDVSDHAVRDRPDRHGGRRPPGLSRRSAPGHAGFRVTGMS